MIVHVITRNRRRYFVMALHRGRQVRRWWMVSRGGLMRGLP